MTWRALGVVALLAVVGFGGGVTAASQVAGSPVRQDATVPVVAADPPVPTTPPIEVLPDPTTPALAPDVPTHQEKIGQDPFALVLPVPNGWVRSNSRPGVWTWLAPENPERTYLMRVTLPSGFQTIGSALEDRIAALDGATGIQELTVEERDADGFTGTYVVDRYRRVTVERFLALDGTQTVYANVAIIGREVDRAGMLDLLDAISAAAHR